ncbi:hypothetical protein J2W44_005011 [Priestia aryabhattai]|nr:hypothetical protein [Priestia aryabhattai]
MVKLINLTRYVIYTKIIIIFIIMISDKNPVNIVITLAGFL